MSPLFSVAQDLHYGARSLRRTPGFTAIAVAVLSLGIGVNATVFSLANAFFLRPLPVAEPSRVVRVYANVFSNVSQPLYEQLRDRNSTLQGLAGFHARPFALIAGGEPEHAFGEVVTGNYFPVLGLQPARGRLLAPSDDVAGAAPAVVLSHAFWVRRFGGADSIVGSTITLNGAPFTVVGVADRRFTGVLGPITADLWVPIAMDAVLRPALDAEARRRQSLHLVGRLKPGAGREGAQADLDTIGRQVRSAAGEERPQRAVTVYGPTMLHPEASNPVTAFTAVLMAVVALVLLIVCVNIANLVLARATGRRAEFAVRQSLGAWRGRLVRQLLTENLLLSLAGAAGGLAIALWTTRLAMSATLPAPVPIHLDLSVDGRVLAFTTLVAVLATLAFGLAPALTASRVDLVSALKGESAGGVRHGRMRSAFLVTQVAMSILLLVTAALLIRSFRAAQSMDTGFDAAGVTTASIDLETRGYTEQRGVDLTRALVERLEARGGVASANVVDIVPLTLSNRTAYLLRAGDAPPAAGQAPPTPQVYVNAVGPGHFETLRMPLLAGRDFSYQDSATAPQAVIVNETLARRFWPGEDAIGKRLRPLDEADRRERIVVGVVRDSKYVTVGEESRPFLYRPLAQSYTPRITLLVRGSASTAATITVIREELRALDPGLAVFNAGAMRDATAISLLPARVAGNLLGVLGAFALLLAALGIYGVLSFLVRARRREIGIRVAVGATPREVASLVVRQAMRWTLTGAAIGLGLAFALTRLLDAFLYGIDAADPWTFGGVTLLLGIVAFVAALLPAHRAARVDPIDALRAL